MTLTIVSGDLLEAKEKYIVHQCNCISTNSLGLAEKVFNKFPYSNVYKERIGENNLPLPGQEPGNIIVCGNGENERYIINLFGQFYPGKPKFENSEKDGVQARLKFFINGLEKIFSIRELESIAFPYGIGCGLAGGNWEIYQKIINGFSHLNKDVQVSIYKM